MRICRVCGRTGRDSNAVQWRTPPLDIDPEYPTSACGTGSGGRKTQEIRLTTDGGPTD